MTELATEAQLKTMDLLGIHYDYPISKSKARYFIMKYNQQHRSIGKYSDLSQLTPREKRAFSIPQKVESVIIDEKGCKIYFEKSNLLDF